MVVTLRPPRPEWAACTHRSNRLDAPAGTRDDGGVDDQVYADTLLAILTNPSPTGISPDDPYGLADDRIDRYDGFSRDMWVVGLEVVEAEHGAELEVAFELKVPPGSDWRDAPNLGTVRLPFDAGWRRLSGYDDPADYAPKVARSVFAATHRLLERHHTTQTSTLRGEVRPVMPSREVQWRALLDALSGEGHPVEVAPGRIELRTEDDAPDAQVEADSLTILVTPDQWEQVLRQDEFALSDPGLYLQELIAPRDEDENFVVFYHGGLSTSIRAELPPVHGTARARRTAGRIASIRAKDPDATFEWTAEERPQRAE